MRRELLAYLFLEHLAVEADDAKDSYGVFVRDRIDDFFGECPEGEKRTGGSPHTLADDRKALAAELRAMASRLEER